MLKALGSLTCHLEPDVVGRCSKLSAPSLADLHLGRVRAKGREVEAHGVLEQL